MSKSRFVVALIVAISSQGYAQTSIANETCVNPDYICENIWYCKDGSYPEKYVACGHDGLVDRVCCDPTYKQTKSRKYCETLYKKIEIDEYGNRDFGSIVRISNVTTINAPHAAALGIRDGSKTNWTCAGSLITDKFIITAARCVNQNINIVRLGDLDFNRDDDNVGPQEYGIIRYIIHPNYTPPTVYNDLALIELNETVRFTKFVRPTCLHDEKILREITWWEAGFKKPGKMEMLTDVVLMQSPKEECIVYFDSKKYANLVPMGINTESQLCGSTRYSMGMCQLDIGGPLHLRDLTYTDGTFLAGVTAIPHGCGNNTEYGLYTRISNYIPWIESIVFPENK